ncbi:MAG: hypothetical protein Q9195_007293 [Heterodermia aff. obscurata]
MSFGWSVSDVASLARLAHKTWQGARAACGEYSELARETSSLHVILDRLHAEVERPESYLHKRSGTHGRELKSISDGCGEVLGQLDKILVKYNALAEQNTLSGQERSVRRLWKKIRFGNGAVVVVAELRSRITYYTAALSLFLNLISASTLGDVEKKMDRADENLKDIKVAINSIAARLMAASESHDGSVMTAYTNDDRGAWRELRRELAGKGIKDSLVRKHKKTIMAYINELGSRGMLDAVDRDESEADVTNNPVEQDDPSPSMMTSSSAFTVQDPETEIVRAPSPLSRNETERLGSFSIENSSNNAKLASSSENLAEEDNIVEKPYFDGNHKRGAAESHPDDISSANLTRGQESTTSLGISVERKPAHQQFIRDSLTPNRQEDTESASEEESDSAHSASSSDASTSFGQPSTDNYMPDLPIPHHNEPLGNYNPAMPVDANTHSKSTIRRSHSDSDDESYFTSEASNSLTEANLQRHTVADFRITLAPLVKHPLPIYQPSRFIASESMVEDKGTRFASSQFAQTALREIPRFHSRIIGLFGTGLPNWDTFSRHEQDTSTTYEEVIVIDEYAWWAKDLLMAMNHFCYLSCGSGYVEARPNTFDPQDLHMLCTKVFLELWPQKEATSAQPQPIGDGKELFLLDTVREIGEWNDGFDKACNAMVSHIGMNYGTGGIRHALVQEWDAGYEGMIDPEHWIIAQGLHKELLPDQPYRSLVRLLARYYRFVLEPPDQMESALSATFCYIEKCLYLLQLRRNDTSSRVGKTTFDFEPDFRSMDTLYAAILALQKELGFGFGHFWVLTWKQPTTDQNFAYRGCLTESLFNAGAALFNRALRFQHSKGWDTKFGWEKIAEGRSMSRLEAILISQGYWSPSSDRGYAVERFRDESRQLFAIPWRHGGREGLGSRIRSEEILTKADEPHQSI